MAKEKSELELEEPQWRIALSSTSMYCMYKLLPERGNCISHTMIRDTNTSHAMTAEFYSIRLFDFATHALPIFRTVKLHAHKIELNFRENSPFYTFKKILFASEHKYIASSNL